MLSDNIKILRKAKGLSQDELAIQLNVVRQTVSKWENGLSVPDSEMLVKLASTLETTVNALLSESVEPDIHSDLQVLANKLEVINAQLLNQRETRRKVWGLFLSFFPSSPSACWRLAWRASSVFNPL